jgi:hypothetical protein
MMNDPRDDAILDESGYFWRTHIRRRSMAKKLNKLTARVSALEKTIAEFLTDKTTGPKSKTTAKANQKRAKKAPRNKAKRTATSGKKAAPKKGRKAPKKALKKVAVAQATRKSARKPAAWPGPGSIDTHLS